MRKLFIFFCCFLYSYLFSQKTYVFNVVLNDKSNAPTFAMNNGLLVYNGTNPDEANFFRNYSINNFYATYPNYSGYLLNVFTFITSSPSLINDLGKKFPEKYLRTEDLSDIKVELVSFPNDYGNGINYYNPTPNLGANISLKSFDYVNTPKAWDYFPNNTPKGNVTIGISDGMVNTSDIDLGPSKVSYLHQNLFYPVFNCMNGFQSIHGTGVAAIAAAQGNNAHGITGVCYDCNILNIPYQVDANTPYYNGLMELAQAGVRVINMSWIQGYIYNDPSYISGYLDTQQEAINQLYNMGVVLVAGAGNNGSFVAAAAPSYQVHCYPASYDHVISVTLVYSKNHNITDETDSAPTSIYGYRSFYNEDIITPVGGILDLNNPVFVPFNEWATTTNSRVDICAPAYAPHYSNYLLGCLDQNGNPALYADATSSATPFVTGTVALMQSLNPCILPGEVEDVLQLASKNIEIKPENVAFIGTSGSGKLETGDAVEFTHEMMSSNGNALVDGQDFWRFDFNLKHIFNGLTISNQIFREQNTTNFTAKNFIDVTQNADFRPNSNGFVDLNIDSNLNVCNPSSKIAEKSIPKTKIETISKPVVLYPNPNNGTFFINTNQADIENLDVGLYDIFGKLIYQTKVNTSTFEISIPNLKSGVYLLKLNSNTFIKTLKFIKK